MYPSKILGVSEVTSCYPPFPKHLYGTVLTQLRKLSGETLPLLQKHPVLLGSPAVPN